jgi:hypothetical protein
MYFGPLLALIAIGWTEERYISRITHHASRFTFHVSLIALVALQLLVMNTRWLVNDSFLDEPPERSVVMNPPPMSFTTPAEFANQIALRGYDVRTSNGTLEIDLVWQALAQPPHAYTVFAHVIDANGQQVGQQDNMPVRDQSPTSCWQSGEFVSDPYSIPLPANSRGPFTLEIGLYRGETGTRLPRTDAQGDRVTLTVP